MKINLAYLSTMDDTISMKNNTATKQQGDKMTKLIDQRQPTKEEKNRGAEVVFEREDARGEIHVILACKCYESWEQWGAVREVLSDNVDTVESWRNQ